MEPDTGSGPWIANCDQKHNFKEVQGQRQLLEQQNMRQADRGQQQRGRDETPARPEEFGI